MRKKIAHAIWWSSHSALLFPSSCGNNNVACSTKRWRTRECTYLHVLKLAWGSSHPLHGVPPRFCLKARAQRWRTRCVGMDMKKLAPNEDCSCAKMKNKVCLEWMWKKLAPWRRTHAHRWWRRRCVWMGCQDAPGCDASCGKMKKIPLEWVWKKVALPWDRSAEMMTTKMCLDGMWRSSMTRHASCATMM